ncbi:unnamed protein product [Heligmosomoides polygyrus]|uniref:Arrestin_C domain-containing protein n=1 Tax=Heligmosomoides polygyrus TaxID=6339 RepID=A0A3P7WLY1_HELPZ|nr:unnamed protein product [Heligmosomoides polygyrus]
MPSSTICITYSNPEAVYYPGTNVNGVVHLELKEAIKLLNAGSYQFPFTFQLPLNCAPSYEGLHGYIRYMVKVELDRPWRFNKTDKRLFTVVPMFDLNMIPQAAMPIRECVIKNLGIVLFRHGKVSVQCDIPKTGFVPGETIVINAVVVNDSSKDIIKASTKLVEMSKYVAFRHGSTVGAGAFLENEIGDTARQQRRKLATGEQVKFKTQASFKGDIGTHCHVIVGTIPVRNPYVLAQPSAPPAQVAQTSTSNYPSAPPMDQPPAYPETNGAGVHPPPPPSYEESVKGVGGTTMDTDEMEPFVPRYPFYPQLNVNAIPEKPNPGDSTKT